MADGLLFMRLARSLAAYHVSSEQGRFGGTDDVVVVPKIGSICIGRHRKSSMVGRVSAPPPPGYPHRQGYLGAWSGCSRLLP